MHARIVLGEKGTKGRALEHRVARLDLGKAVEELVPDPERQHLLGLGAEDGDRAPAARGPARHPLDRKVGCGEDDERPVPERKRHIVPVAPDVPVHVLARLVEPERPDRRRDRGQNAPDERGVEPARDEHGHGYGTLLRGRAGPDGGDDRASMIPLDRRERYGCRSRLRGVRSPWPGLPLQHCQALLQGGTARIRPDLANLLSIGNSVTECAQTTVFSLLRKMDLIDSDNNQECRHAPW